MSSLKATAYGYRSASHELTVEYIPGGGPQSFCIRYRDARGLPVYSTGVWSVDRKATLRRAQRYIDQGKVATR